MLKESEHSLITHIFANAFLSVHSAPPPPQTRDLCYENSQGSAPHKSLASEDVHE